MHYLLLAPFIIIILQFLLLSLGRRMRQIEDHRYRIYPGAITEGYIATVSHRPTSMKRIYCRASEMFSDVRSPRVSSEDQVFLKNIQAAIIETKAIKGRCDI